MKRSVTRLFTVTLDVWTSRALTCAVLLVASAHMAQGAINAWTSHGPYGGEVTALAIDPTATPSTLYAGTGGGFNVSVNGGGVFKSTDSGGSWSVINTGRTDQCGTAPPVNVLVIDPATPGTLYAGGEGGVYQSTNRGRSWSGQQGPGTGGTSYALVIDPNTPSTLYSGSYGGGVFKSTDSGVGASWSAVNTGLTNLSVVALAIDPTATPSTLYAGTYFGGVFRSTNGGGSWSAVNTGLSGLSNEIIVYALAIDVTTTPSTLYAGTDGTYGGAVFKSTDSGGSWSAANTGLTDNLGNLLSVAALAIDPTTTPSTLYAGTYGGGVFQSTNSGGSWSAVNTGLSNLSVPALAIDPRTTPSTIYAGTTGGGVFQSTNSGGSWSVINTGLSAIQPRITKRT